MGSSCLSLTASPNSDHTPTVARIQVNLRMWKADIVKQWIARMHSSLKAKRILFLAGGSAQTCLAGPQLSELPAIKGSVL